ncbi:YjbQ family protein [Candidatus Woesearchaeota archaeon]|nr:YjbQ family protein [Candidatus Woesearchaeota archaeon]
MVKELRINTSSGFQIISINERIEDIVEDTGIKKGIVNVFTPHATAAIIINENADPNIGTDLIDALERMVPLRAGYLHDRIDGNAAAHIKAAIIGPSQNIPIRHGELLLGTWQDIMLCEFDGPKIRKVIVTIISEEE